MIHFNSLFQALICLGQLKRKTGVKETGDETSRLDFRRLPGPVFDFPEQRLVIEPTRRGPRMKGVCSFISFFFILTDQ